MDAVYCLGDLVGYATWPNEVVTSIQERGIPTIAGNYDEGVGPGSDDCGCAYQTDEDKARGAESMPTPTVPSPRPRGAIFAPCPAISG